MTGRQAGRRSDSSSGETLKDAGLEELEERLMGWGGWSPAMAAHLAVQWRRRRVDLKGRGQRGGRGWAGGNSP